MNLVERQDQQQQMIPGQQEKTFQQANHLLTHVLEVKILENSDLTLEHALNEYSYCLRMHTNPETAVLNYTFLTPS